MPTFSFPDYMARETDVQSTVSFHFNLYTSGNRFYFPVYDIGLNLDNDSQ